MRQNDIEKIIAYQKCFIGPLVWKCFTNNFELLLSEKKFPTFCTFFMYINVHGHQIFAKCTLNECTKMELDPPPGVGKFYYFFKLTLTFYNLIRHIFNRHFLGIYIPRIFQWQ